MEFSILTLDGGKNWVVRNFIVYCTDKFCCFTVFGKKGGDI